jgi:SAM-dependent methyltransferase
VSSALPPLLSTQRFTDRVDHYVRYRPSYPAGVTDELKKSAGLGPTSVVADIASGTGIFTQLLLPHCARVYGVEPNDAMRAAADRLLVAWPTFTSVTGTAEATNLPAGSVDLVTAAQAFHWFDVAASRREFARILRPGGHVAIVWNERRTGATPFLTDYEEVLKRHALDYERINHMNVDATAVAEFFGAAGYALTEFPNEQRFDCAGLQGRVLSSSYAPNLGHPGHAPMMAALELLFAKHAQAGVVHFPYTTKLYLGRLPGV